MCSTLELDAHDQGSHQGTDLQLSSPSPDMSRNGYMFCCLSEPPAPGVIPTLSRRFPHP